MLCVSKPPLGRAVDAALEAVTSMCCAGNWAPWGAEPVCWRKDPEHTEWYEEDLRSFVPLFVHFLFKPQSSQQLQQKKKPFYAQMLTFCPGKTLLDFCLPPQPCPSPTGGGLMENLAGDKCTHNQRQSAECFCQYAMPLRSIWRPCFLGEPCAVLSFMLLTVCLHGHCSQITLKIKFPTQMNGWLYMVISSHPPHFFNICKDLTIISFIPEALHQDGSSFELPELQGLLVSRLKAISGSEHDSF